MKKARKPVRRILAALLTLALIVTLAPATPGLNIQASAGTAAETPVFVVTGDGLIENGEYTKENIGFEKSYTLDELKAIAGDKCYYIYSGVNRLGNPSYTAAHGVKIADLLGENVSVLDTEKLTVYSPKNYAAGFDPAGPNQNGTYENGKYVMEDGEIKKDENGNSVAGGFNLTRYAYQTAGEAGSASAKGTEVPTVIAWQNKDADSYDAVPSGSALEGETEYLRLLTGQVDYMDVNSPLFNGKDSDPAQKAVVGDALTEFVLTVGDKSYTRAEVLMMPFTSGTYSYSTTGGDKTDTAKGVPMSELLKDFEADDVVTFASVDNNPVEASGKTVKDLIDGNYLLAYEVQEDGKTEKTAVFDTAKKDPSKQGYFRLYGGDSLGKMICTISVTTAGTDYSKSPYKHITNGGLTGQDGPYDIDGITGATLTVEGPGVKNSVPLPVRDLEGQNKGAFRGDYTDMWEGESTDRTYEGIDLYYLLNNMSSGTNGIILTNDAYKVQIKNRNRQTTVEFTLEQVKEAHDKGKPIIIAYGTSYTDGTNVRPFVFDGGTGEDKTLGNQDGCLKLVYDPSVITGDTNSSYTKFINMAYVYVCEADEPGFKHTGEIYGTPENLNYVLTVTGSEIGREVNYTVKQLEDMVSYTESGEINPSGLGYRDEYSLANSSYWYVNRYEGVKLWDLLLKSGLPASKASDDTTKTRFEATDGYTAFDEFTLKQIADPEQFGFYEKNAEDLGDGKYIPVESDLKKTGYPVLVSYGVNGYPYVQKNSQPGYLSGLANDGGPLRIISGKVDYNHANGSNQAKLLDKVIVGDNTYHYSTHKYSDPNTDNGRIYTGLAESQTLQIKIVNGSGETAPVLKEKAYKLGELEELIYGGTLTKNQLSEAKVKAFYEVGKGDNYYSDLYEGINLIYFLKNEVELPGYKGTVTFSDGTNTLNMPLEEVLSYSGRNNETKISGLTPVLAYAKNGAPMVKNKDADGYQKDVTLAEGTKPVTVKNDGGSLQVIFPRKDAEGTPQSLSNVTSITINLSPDKYAHTAAPYDTLAENTITIGGEGVRNEKTYTVSELEGKQTLAVTGDYSFLNESGQTSQLRYRGISLYSLLSSSEIGLKSNADQVIVTFADEATKTFSLSEVLKSNYLNSVTGAEDLRMILAYGSASVENTNKEDGKPLVATNEAAGYDAAYGNSGGPIKLVVGQKDAEDVNEALENVVSIEVTASDMVSWNHSVSDIFKTYLGYEMTLEVVDQDNAQLYSKVYTVEELEAMTDLVEQAELNSTSKNTYEGLNLWKLIQKEAGSVSGIKDPTTITLISGSDNFSVELRSKVGLDGLQNGVKDGAAFYPVLLCYGMDGLPLAVGDKTITNRGPGYEPLVGNDGGPLKLMVHNAQGACLTNVNKIVVKIGGTVTEPEEEKDFNIYGFQGSTLAYDIRALKGLAKVQTASYTSKKGTDFVRGIYLSELLERIGVSGENVKITINTTDGYEDKADAAACYKNISLKDIADQKYFIAYDISQDSGESWEKIEDKDKTEIQNVATIRIYRNLDDGSTWYNRVTNVKGITVSGASGGGGAPSTITVDTFTIKGDKFADKVFPIGGSGGIKQITTGSGGKATASYTYTSDDTEQTDNVKGIYLKDLLSYAGIGSNVVMTVNTTDGFENKTDKAGSYLNITYADIVAQNYFLAYDVNEAKVEDADKNRVKSCFRLYRNYDDGGSWKNCMKNISGITLTETDQFAVIPADGSAGNLPLAGIRAIEEDSEGGLWIGTYGGGYAYRAPGTNAFVVTNKSNNETMKTTFVSAVAVDKEGGVWFTQNASYTDLTKNYGVGYYKDGEYTYYTVENNPGTIPNNYVQAIEIDKNGNVWFGSFGGLTKFDGTNWTTISKADGLPAESVCRIELDENGGVWVGCYPTGTGTAEDGFVGGYAYVKNGKIVKSWTLEAGIDKIIGQSRLGDVWIRDIALDKKGGAWIVASGSYAGMDNVGGTIWYVDADKNATKYTGYDLLGSDVLDGATNAEVRMVAVDPDGGLWFGTSADGVIYVADPAVKNGKMTVTKEYSSKTAAWMGMGDNVYALDFIGYTLYVGTSNGLAYRTFEFEGGSSTGTGSETKATVGDATAATADLTVTGATKKNGYFTLDGLKNTKGLEKANVNVSWLNSYGSKGTTAARGVALSDLLDYVGLAGNAKSVTVKARDGYAKSFDLNDKKNGVYWKDKDGNPVILAWVVDGKNAEGGLQLIIGQENDEDINRPNWVKDIVSITVNAKSASSSENSDPTWNGDKEDPDAPVTEVITQIVDAKTIVIGTAAVSSVNAKELQEAVSAAEKQTGEGKEAVVEINAVSGNKNVDEVSVTIPKAGLESAAAAENTDLAVKTDLADLVLTSELAAELKDFGDLKITVKKTGEGTLNVAFTGGNKAVEDLENAIKISAADTGLAKDNAVVYLVSEDGTKKVLPFSAIVDGKVVFETRAMGTFSVEYKERVFADTENHWSKDNVSFLAVRGVINGKSADRFDPDGKVTRAEFVKMLAGLAEDVDFSQVKPMGFSDVKTGDWYAQFANWAASEGIVTGYTDGTFRGNDYITREQMAAMIERFVAAVGDNLKIVNEKKTFTDSSAISPWAVNSVNKVCQYGLLNGNANGTIAPQADTTRAQAATVLVNYIKAVLK